MTWADRLMLFGIQLGVVMLLWLHLNEHPADGCQEDEVWWWVANDVRACQALGDIPR